MADILDCGTLVLTAACPSRTTAPSNATPIMLKLRVPWANDDHDRSTIVLDYPPYLLVLWNSVNYIY